MANPNPATTSYSATERMERARAAHQDTKAEIIALAAVLTRVWPSFVAPSSRPDAMFPNVLCIDSPAGRLAYRLTVDDLPAFEHVPRQDVNDGVPCGKADRLVRLLHLGSDGW